MKTSLQFIIALTVVIIAGLPVWAEQNIVIPAPTPSTSIATEPVKSVTNEPSAINHVVYLAQLPTPSELIKGAEGQGIKIVRIDQTPAQIVVAYVYPGPRTVTFAYTLLGAIAFNPAQATGPTAVPAPSDTVVYSQPPPAPQIIYTQPGTDYCLPYVNYYDPAWDFWPPLAFGAGIGWFSGHGGDWHGDHGGDWRGGHSGRFRGGWQGSHGDHSGGPDGRSEGHVSHGGGFHRR